MKSPQPQHSSFVFVLLVGELDRLDFPFEVLAALQAAEEVEDISAHGVVEEAFVWRK